MKKALFVVNDRWSLKLGSTNLLLMKACRMLGYAVCVTDVVHFYAQCAAETGCEAIRLPDSSKVKSNSALQKMLSAAKNELLPLAEVDAVFLRTSPGKDTARAWAHRLTLEALRLASENGVRVINDPAGLQKASSKFYTVCLPPDVVPKTLVCHSLQSVQNFVDQLEGPVVIKPLLGSQGRDVFFFDDASAVNTRQVVDILGRTGYLVVQEYLPAAVDGDVRVLTLGDSIFHAHTGVRRTPADGEMRSNISLGGTAAIVDLSDAQISVCNRIAKQLEQEGILFAGLDLIGEKVVEVNVFSPSGLQEYDRHFGNEASQSLVNDLLNG